MRYAEKWPIYARDWDRMVIKPARRAEFNTTVVDILIDAPKYREIERATAIDGVGKEGQGVPWPLIALLHLRESSRDFSTYLGNGQSLRRKTTIVPKGRGPFKSFYDGALDALAVDGLSAVIDWNVEKVLYWQELFNGTGYHQRGLPAPYIWGGTNIQKAGKYVSDGAKGWRGNVWDTQPGCAPILKLLMDADSSITLGRES